MSDDRNCVTQRDDSGEITRLANHMFVFDKDGSPLARCTVCGLTVNFGPREGTGVRIKPPRVEELDER